MPYIGYISLIKHTDMFILFDTVQFIRHGWIERNRMLKQSEGWHVRRGFRTWNAKYGAEQASGHLQNTGPHGPKSHSWRNRGTSRHKVVLGD